ncbi:DUF1189 family protein [Chitinispirillales bacterium ANBcel5]|uniref:DUF1189 family protein n=1 Tax=Cellulosispirillum alkaliphilum TaxID=3039283 RepID=UPI002A5322F4|nr:DUF1189 family protein [Chitinispirillales bacterium ANBcel5]
MKFFSELHRSIFEPLFYREVLGASRLKITGYLFKLFVFATILTSLFKTYYIIDTERGIATPLSQLFSEMEIKEGKLYPNRPEPYIPSTRSLSAILDRMVIYPHIFAAMPDTFLVVDTQAKEWDGERKPGILMNKTSVVLQPFTSSEIVIPYSRFLGESDFSFTPSLIRSVLVRNMFSLFLNSLIWSSVFFLFVITSSVLFLGIAAFLFRIEKKRKINQFFRIASFASTPVILGNVIVAFAGVKNNWIWHIFIFISTIVMFRAIVATTPEKNKKDRE